MVAGRQKRVAGATPGQRAEEEIAEAVGVERADTADEPGRIVATAHVDAAVGRGDLDRSKEAAGGHEQVGDEVEPGRVVAQQGRAEADVIGPGGAPGGGKLGRGLGRPVARQPDGERRRPHAGRLDTHRERRPRRGQERRERRRVAARLAEQCDRSNLHNPSRCVALS